MTKLIRVEKNPRGLSYLDTYYFECSDCGKEYFRHANNKRISPYCGKCQRKHDNEKQKERLKAKKNQSTIVFSFQFYYSAIYNINNRLYSVYFFELMVTITKFD